MEIDDVLTTVMGDKVLVQDVLVCLKAKGIFRQAIYEVIEKRVVEIMADREGITLPEDELAEKRDEKRAMMGLSDPAALQNYLRANGITLAQWSEFVRIAVLKDRLKETAVPDKDVERHFENQKKRYTTASVARIVCKSKDDMTEAIRRLERDSLDFAVAATEFSIDETTRFTGGYVGNIRPGMLATPVDAQVFAAEPDSLLGPFEENGVWTLYKVHSVNVPGLTDSVKNMIRDQLFQDWLRLQVQTIPA